MASNAPFELRFAFDHAELPFCTYAEVIETYASILAPTSIKPVFQEGMLPLFLSGLTSGTAKVCEAAFAPLKTQGISFTWPLFDKWRRIFHEHGIWPNRWHGFVDKAKDRRLSLREEKAWLLPIHIQSAIYHRHRAAQLANMTGYMRARNLKVQHPEPDLEPLIRKQTAKIDPTDWQTFPPFFPGDTSYVTVDRG